MFIEKEDLYTAMNEYQLEQIAASDTTVRMAILAAIDEAKSYLNAKYDCGAIFTAQGDKRHATLLEHCKNLAVWYLIRRANADMIFEQVKAYHEAAIDWLEKVAGLKGDSKPLAPDLPLRKAEDGAVKLSARMGSRTKFSHNFDD